MITVEGSMEIEPDSISVSNYELGVIISANHLDMHDVLDAMEIDAASAISELNLEPSEILNSLSASDIKDYVKINGLMPAHISKDEVINSINSGLYSISELALIHALTIQKLLSFIPKDSK